MVDRQLLYQNEPQLYESQGNSYFIGTPEEVNFIWPINYSESVNERRVEVVLDPTVVAYGRDLFGPEFEFWEISSGGAG